MTSRISHALLKLYVRITGVSFYIHDMDIVKNEPTMELFCKDGSALKFYLTKKRVDYFVYRFGRVVKKVKHRYVVSAGYPDTSPVKLRAFQSISLSLGSNILSLIRNEKVIYMFLITAYLDYLDSELRDH